MENFSNTHRIDTIEEAIPSKLLSEEDLFLNPKYSKIKSIGNNWILETGSESQEYKINEERLKIPITNRKLIPIWRRVRVKMFVIYSLQSIARHLHLIGGDIDVLRRNSIPNMKSFWSITHPEKINIILRAETKINLFYPKGVLNPKGFFKETWNRILVVLLMYTAIFMPYLIAFESIEAFNIWFYIDIAVDAFFTIDIVVNFCTPFQDSSGKIVTSEKKIASNYLKTWFFCDMIASFPLNFLVEYSYFLRHNSMEGNCNNFLRLLRLPKICRLIRFERLFKTFKSKETEFIEKIKTLLNMQHSQVRLLKSFGSILMLVHIFACIWYYIARIENFEPDSWVVRANLRNENKFTLYITSVYWTITTLTTVGYGDISPKTSLELEFSCFLMILGMYLISFTIGSLASILSSAETKDKWLFNKLSTIEEFSKEAKLNKSLYKKIKQTIQYKNKRTGFTENELNMILSELSSSLKCKVAIAMHRGEIDKLTFFVNRGEVFIGEIVPFLLPEFYSTDDYVYEIRDFATEIYFVLEGRVNYEHYEEPPMVVQSIRRGNYFGDIEVTKEITRIFSAVIEKNCHLLVMNRELVQKVKENFQLVWKELEEVADRREEKIDRIIEEIYEYKHFEGRDYVPIRTSENFDEILMKERERSRKRMFAVIEREEDFRDDQREIHEKLNIIIEKLIEIDEHIQNLAATKPENLKISIQ